MLDRASTRPDEEPTMTTLDDVRKTIEAALGNLTPEKAQQLAKSLTEPGAAKEQVAKAATDLLEWSQRNRERVSDFVRREIAEQLTGMGVATQGDLDGLKKRVRDLERANRVTPSGRKSSTSTRTSTAGKGSPRASTRKAGAASSGDPTP